MRCPFFGYPGEVASETPSSMLGFLTVALTVGYLLSGSLKLLMGPAVQGADL